VDERSEVNILAPRARTTHRTEVTEGIGGVDESLAVNASAPRARATHRGKHRTEVTEVTEGDWRWCRSLAALVSTI
jgi:hypothetical protein